MVGEPMRACCVCARRVTAYLRVSMPFWLFALSMLPIAIAAGPLHSAGLLRAGSPVLLLVLQGGGD